ncbi:uncharacterized protein M421DRAFT_215722 [Didymella exigua CBS 183.55]|uniref:HTH CENPB-type domain-containing protein n=1 Tax=Didymella exigua CBS 183.55 TaxID=1150837 RepID=A0A6A5RH49_9PLEO|nr:uncharacterized protein M421DRAFT_215722 [Didymella exigua CBS 183.55]KAF1926404.1 hypothetical protein M421DRAFT_215722 [Didymella exigua CBS 183.55]
MLLTPAKKSRAEAGLARCNLQLEQETELMKYIEGLTERKLPPTRKIVQNYTSSNVDYHQAGHITKPAIFS